MDGLPRPFIVGTVALALALMLSARLPRRDRMIDAAKLR